MKMEMSGILIVIGKNKFNKALLNFLKMSTKKLVSAKVNEGISIIYCFTIFALFAFVVTLGFFIWFSSTSIGSLGSRTSGYANACSNTGDPELCSQAQSRGNIYVFLILISSIIAGSLALGLGIFEGSIYFETL